MFSLLYAIVMGNVLDFVRRLIASPVTRQDRTHRFEEEQTGSERLPKYTKPLLSYRARELRKHKEYSRQSLVSPTCNLIHAPLFYIKRLRIVKLSTF